jgi:hypothetical protein
MVEISVRWLWVYMNIKCTFKLFQYRYRSYHYFTLLDQFFLKWIFIKHLCEKVNFDRFYIYIRINIFQSFVLFLLFMKSTKTQWQFFSVFITINISILFILVKNISKTTWLIYEYVSQGICKLMLVANCLLYRFSRLYVHTLPIDEDLHAIIFNILIYWIVTWEDKKENNNEPIYF